MSSFQYRTDPLWKATMELGPSLARLADDLPGSEDNGLGKILRTISVDLPATIAADAINSQNNRQLVMLRLVAALELIDHIYPALDTAAARSAADTLAEQVLQSNPVAEPQHSALSHHSTNQVSAAQNAHSDIDGKEAMSSGATPTSAAAVTQSVPVEIATALSQVGAEGIGSIAVLEDADQPTSIATVATAAPTPVVVSSNPPVA